MKSVRLIEKGSYSWVMFGRDPDKPENIIDTNQFLLRAGKRALLLEPGGVEMFSATLAAVLHECEVNEITDMFVSHQDPDVNSSLGLWNQAVPGARLHAPALWEGFLAHYGADKLEYVGIPDHGGTIELGDARVELVPAHYMHASANFNVYDPEAKLFMSGDIGASLEPDGAPLFVDDFDSHVEKMRFFHQRWLPSNSAKQDWVNRVRDLDIDIMAPQHGRMFRGDDVKRFLDWLEDLEVGIATQRGRRSRRAA